MIRSIWLAYDQSYNQQTSPDQSYDQDICPTIQPARYMPKYMTKTNPNNFHASEHMIIHMTKAYNDQSYYQDDDQPYDQGLS